MEVHPEVYNWLGALQIIDGSRPPTINNSGMAALDEDTTMDFENGAVRPATRETPGSDTPLPDSRVASGNASSFSRASPADPPPSASPSVPSLSKTQGFGVLLSSLGAQRGMPPAPIDAFKMGGSPVSRLYNWNLLGPVLVPFGIRLSDDDKALVVAGDRDFVSHILSQFYERTVGELPMVVPKTRSFYMEDEGSRGFVIDNGAVAADDPSPITSRLAEMGVRDTQYRKSAFGDTLPGEDRSEYAPAPLPVPEKLPGETGPAAAPLRGADDGKDPFQFLDDPSAPKTPLELLGRSIEQPFGLKRGEGEVLLARQPATFQDWMRGADDPPKAPRGRGHPALNWLDAMRAEIRTLAAMLTGKSGAPAETMSLGAASAVFDVLGAGLASKDRRVYFATVQNLCALGRRMKDFPVLRQAQQWLAAAGGPSTHLVRILTAAAKGYGPANIRVGDAKAAADAARVAAADAANGFAPDYEAEPEERAGAQFSLAFHADDESGPDSQFAERAAEAAAVAELVERFCRGSPKHLKTFLLEDLRHGADARSNPKPYIDALNVLMPALLARGPSPRNALATEDTPGMVFLEALRCAEGPADLREASLSLLTTLWSAFPDEIEVKGEDCRQAVSVLKRGARDVERATQIHALACLFQLLHAFINAANAFSPVVYKTIVFMLIEHMRNDVVRDFITAELKVALDTHSNIPVGILVDPVVKQTSPGGQHPGLKRGDFELIASMSEHARLEARPALHLLALCLRSALDHTAGENPAGERAIALKAATRLAARLKGEEAAEEALERAAGGALARIAAENDDQVTDPFFGESQRCAAEVLLATAHSMTAVGGAGVGHLRGIVRDAATNYAARNGTTHPDIEAALHVLSLAAEIGSYNPSPELIPSPGRARVLPPSPGNRNAPPLASHQRAAPPGGSRVIQRKVSDAPFASPPERTSELDPSTGRTHQAGERETRRPPGRAANPFVESGGSLESSFDAHTRGGYEPSERAASQRRPSLGALHSARGGATRSSHNSQALGSDGTGSEPFVIDPERVRRPANPTSSRALSAQREKRDAEISKIAARRAQRERERERAAREAEEDAEAERLLFQQKMRAKREQLAAKAAAKGRGGQFASVTSAERANEHLHPPREKFQAKPPGPPPRQSPRKPPPPAAATAAADDAPLSPPAAEDSEGLLQAEDSELVAAEPVAAADDVPPAAEDSEEAMDADMASPPVPPVATTSPSGRSLNGSGSFSGSKFGASSPRQKSLVKGAGGFGPPPTTGDRVPRARSSSSAKVPKLSAENSYLKLKREEEKLKREKEDRERRKEEQRAAKAQAQHALNLKRNLEAKKKEKELQEKERKLALKQAREKAKAAAEVKAAAERKRQEDNKRLIEAYNVKKAAEREALEKMAAEKKAEEARKSKQTAAEAARAAKAASLARPKKVREHKVVGIMGVKPPPDPVSPRRRPSGAGSPRPSAPAEPPEQIDE
jgi:hypothetical protein